MHRIRGFLVAVAILAGPTSLQAQSQDLDLLQGKWASVFEQSKGKAKSKDELREMNKLMTEARVITREGQHLIMSFAKDPGRHAQQRVDDLLQHRRVSRPDWRGREHGRRPPPDCGGPRAGR